jgi:hypothetical protein
MMPPRDDLHATTVRQVIDAKKECWSAALKASKRQISRFADMEVALRRRVRAHSDALARVPSRTGDEHGSAGDNGESPRRAGMLGRIVSVIGGALIFAAGAYTLFLQVTSGGPYRGFIVGMGGVLLLLGVYALWTGLRRRR